MLNLYDLERAARSRQREAAGLRQARLIGQARIAAGQAGRAWPDRLRSAVGALLVGLGQRLVPEVECEQTTAVGACVCMPAGS